MKLPFINKKTEAPSESSDQTTETDNAPEDKETQVNTNSE